MKTHVLVLECLLLTCGGLHAQQPTDPGDLIRPGTVIGGHRFEIGTAIDSISFNSKGGFAFIARWRETSLPASMSVSENAAIFTPDRVVARIGDQIDGRILAGFRSVAIDQNGRVAFQADWYDPKIPSTAIDPPLNPQVVFAETSLGFILTLSDSGDGGGSLSTVTGQGLNERGTGSANRNPYPKVPPITGAKASPTCTTPPAPAANNPQNSRRLPPWARRQLEAAGVSMAGQSNSATSGTQPCSPAAGTNLVTK